MGRCRRSPWWWTSRNGGLLQKSWIPGAGGSLTNGSFEPYANKAILSSILGGPVRLSTAIQNPPGNARQIPVAQFAYCAGMVINGSCSVPPVPESVKKNMTAVIARFVRKSPSSIQNQ